MRIGRRDWRIGIGLSPELVNGNWEVGKNWMVFGNSAISWQHQTGIGIVTQFRQKCHITKEALQIRDHALLSSAPHHAKDMLTPV